MKNLDGQERREAENMSQEERDLLIRIDANLTHLTSEMKAHIIADSNAFEKINSKIGWLQKIVFMGLGALAILKLIYK